MFNLLRLHRTARPLIRLDEHLYRRARTTLVVVAVASALVSVMWRQSVTANVGLLALLALVPISERLGLPRDTTHHMEVATFTLVVAAADIHSGVGAFAVGLAGILVGDWLRGHAIRSDILTRALILTLLVAVGTIVQLHPTLTLVGFACWYIAAALMLADCLCRNDWGGVIAALLAAAWITVMSTMPVWMAALPDAARRIVMPGVPALQFALGFMTADLLLVNAIGLRQSGPRGIRFWRREFSPLFARYNGLAVGGTVMAAVFAAQPIIGLALVGAVFVMLLMFRREVAYSGRRLIATICALSSALDARDPDTKGHSDRVAAYSVAIADRLCWPAARRRELEIAAHLHDVGKIGVPDAVLLKADRLTVEEIAIIQRHAQLSADIVRNVGEFRQVAIIIRQHHERLDGSGYPLGIRADQQIAPARVLAVADVFDALTSPRPYRSPLSREEALQFIARDRARLYDASVVDALTGLVHDDAIEGAIQYGYCLTH